MLTDTDNDAATERRQIEQLRARGADGFIIATARWDDPLLDEIAAAGLPAVLVNRNTATRRFRTSAATSAPAYGSPSTTWSRWASRHRLHRRTAGHVDRPGAAAAFRQAMRATSSARGRVR